MGEGSERLVKRLLVWKVVKLSRTEIHEIFFKYVLQFEVFERRLVEWFLGMYIYLSAELLILTYDQCLVR